MHGPLRARRTALLPAAAAFFLISWVPPGRPAPLAAEAAPAPPGIADNSFFIEEAYNQEAGVVQHIQSAHWSRDREGGSRTRAFSYSFTQEWPLAGMRHQISYTLPYERLGGDQERAGGLADVLVNYRYQLWEESETRPAFAPRVSLLLPTGDDGEGIGAGSPGVQVNLPLSKRIGDLHLHLNAGFTAVPGARRELAGGGGSPSRDLLSFQTGFSAILLVRPTFNVLFEFLSRVEEGIDETGAEEETTGALFSPGARYAINTRSGAQWVLGAALPVGLSSGEDDVGFLAYLSFEHPFGRP